MKPFLDYNQLQVIMGQHRTYECKEGNGQAKCELVKTEPSCEDKVTFVSKDESCSCN
ncbi:MAG: hypothetical protein GWN01_13525 [Nitrosopumilaceae archaeon]|nr:hypothetical protein [Nitrosopumilaceae archaeon]NIU88288.1 hypothetical protein [Nitrosopumilaceae archaeon]NIV66580.1 hypothetical protein [Nitrosopumilaceae archaeon]NIX62485.1 hypothetical protein [Nitrosopumilaceae archaeon]